MQIYLLILPAANRLLAPVILQLHAFARPLPDEAEERDKVFRILGYGFGKRFFGGVFVIFDVFLPDKIRLREFFGAGNGYQTRFLP
jgi:hypothetical protein